MSCPHHLQVVLLSQRGASYYIIKDEALRILIDPIVDIVSLPSGVGDWEVGISQNIWVWRWLIDPVPSEN